MYLIFNFGKENKMQDKFKYINNQSRFAFGFEPEFNCQIEDYQLNQINRTSSSPVHGLFIKRDGSQADWEMDLPVLADCQLAWDYLKECCNFVTSNGGTVNKHCSAHVHLSTLPIRSDLTNEEFTRKSIEMKRHSNNYLEDINNLKQLFEFNEDTNSFTQLPLEVYKDVGYRISSEIDFYKSTIASSRWDCYYARFPKSPSDILRADPTIESLKNALNSIAPRGIYKYTALNINHYNVKKTFENRSHGGTLEMNKMRTWFKFLSNIIDHTVQKRFKARTELQQLTSPSYIGRSANTVKSRLWDFCRGQVRSTREIMQHCNINNAQSVRRTISEIRDNDHYKSFVVTHNQQEFGVDYGHSRDHGDNGYEVLISKDVEVETGDIEKIEDENLRGEISLIAGLDDQTLADLNERIRTIPR
tara:strand:+ start:1314 stop:2564 length:1251 start_codon:yes stop_codon:yes gene_type:complete